MGVVAQQTPNTQILPLVPTVPELMGLWTWAHDLNRTLQQNLDSIARKANDTSTYPMTADLNAGGFSITNLLNLTLSGTITYTGGANSPWVRKIGDTMTGGLVLPAGTTTVHPLTIPHGAAATSPTNGDLWSTTAAFFARINGTTYTLASLEATQTFSGNLTFSGTITYSGGSNSPWVLKAGDTMTGNLYVVFPGATNAIMTLVNSASASAALLGSGGNMNQYFDNTKSFVFRTDTRANIAASTITGSVAVWTLSNTGDVTMTAGLTGATTITASSNINTTAGTYKLNGTAIPFVKAFVSAQQTITSAGSLTIAHGLGVKPDIYLPYLQCVTAEGGYSIGDEIMMNPGFQASAAVGAGVSIVPDATNLNVRYGSNNPIASIINKTTGAVFNITNANWKLVVKAWA